MSAIYPINTRVRVIKHNHLRGKKGRVVNSWKCPYSNYVHPKPCFHYWVQLDGHEITSPHYFLHSELVSED